MVVVVVQYGTINDGGCSAQQLGGNLVSSRRSLQRRARRFCTSFMDRLALLTGG